MTRNTWRRTALAVALVAGTTTVAAAGPAGADGPAARVTTYENFRYEPGPGGGLVLDWGYAPAHITVPRGSVVTFQNTSGAQSGEPHTVSVVSYAHVPKTIDAILNCGAPGTVCASILTSHDPDGDQEPPFVKAVNRGREGLNQEGDSRLLLPGERAYTRITAASGTTVHYICAIHAWMQATITVT
jgi:plastocyanin